MMASQGTDSIVARWGALVAILLAQLMMVMDGTVIYTALPGIASALGLTPSTLSWVPNAYLLTLGGFILLGGRIGDLLGLKRVFIFASVGFMLASCAAGLAESAVGLIVSRACQGIAAAFVVPSGFSLLMLLFAAGAERERAIRLYTAVSGAGSALGLLAGGALTSFFSWRYVFFINLPVAVLLLMTGMRYLPATARMTGRFDLPGALTCTPGMILLVYGVVQSAQSDSSHVAVSMLTGAALLLAFIAIERRASYPMLPLSLFRSPQRSGAYVSKVLLVGGMLGTFFFLTQYAQNTLGLSAFDTALIFLPLSLAQCLVVIFVLPAFASRCRHRTLLVAGLLIASGGMLWLNGMEGQALQLTDFIAPMLLLGVGSGVALVPLALLGVHEVTPTQAAAASGLVNATHYLGGAAGTAVMVCLSGVLFDAASPPGAAAGPALTLPALSAVLFFAVAIIITMLTSDRQAR